ncbi:transmembrane protein 61 [Sigmodon hispidus]
MAACETCVRGRVAFTVRYFMTVGGTVILVIGALCFAWWSDDDPAVQPDSLSPTVGHPRPRTPPKWLKSVSFLCCSMGGLLLFFGLLWYIQEGTRRSSQGELYQLSRDLYHLAVESSEKTHRLPKEAVPTYEEAMYCPLAEGPLQFPVQPEEEGEDCQCHALGDSLLGSSTLLPPPSYESIILSQEAVSGPRAASASQGQAQASGELQVSSRPETGP